MSDNSENPKQEMAAAQFRSREECVKLVLRDPKNAPFVELLAMWRSQISTKDVGRGMRELDLSHEALCYNEGFRVAASTLLKMAGY